MPFPVSDHCDGRRFFNPDRSAHRTRAHVARLLTTMRPARWPATIDDVQVAEPPGPLPEGEFAATFVGHATFLVRIGAAAFLFDPVWYNRAGPFGLLGPRRVRRPALQLGDVPDLSAILISHNHYDHMDLKRCVRLSAGWVPRIVTGLGNEAYLRSTGAKVAATLDWWHQHRLDDGSFVTYVPAQHASARGARDQNRALWGGLSSSVMVSASTSRPIPATAAFFARSASVSVRPISRCYRSDRTIPGGS